MSIITEQRSPHAHALIVRGRLDQTQSQELEEALQELLGDQGAMFIIDLTEATYINSAGLRILLTGQRSARQYGGDLIICGLSNRLKEIFEMIGFDQVFTLVDACNDAQNYVV